jgi:hypothetical protein
MRFLQQRRKVLSLVGIVAVIIVPGCMSFSRMWTSRTPLLCRSTNRECSTRPRFPTTESLQFNHQQPSIETNPLSTTCLNMYNLPGGGGGRGGGNGVGNIVTGAVTIVLVVAFFASPLGGLVLGLFNSFLVLLFVLPLFASVGFRIWQSLNTITGSCPNCGSPVTVLKTNQDGMASPTLCFNCGAILQANIDNTGIDNVSGRISLDDSSSSPMGRNPFFDVITTERITTTTTATTTANQDGKERKRRETTIIDVEVEDDEDKPFQ